MKLNFNGTGSAFNPDKRETSAFIIDKQNLILIDCGSTVYTDGYIMGLIEENNIYNVTILITHTHPDHVGGLGSLIMWLYFCKNIVPNLCYGSKFGNETTMRNFLAIQGVSGIMYNWISACAKMPTELYGKYLIESIDTKHATGMESCAYTIADKRNFTSIFYSGDLNQIPDLDYSRFDDIYFEATINPEYKMHLDIEVLKEKMSDFRDKIHVMHCEPNTEAFILKAGFKPARNVWERNGAYEFND